MKRTAEPLVNPVQHLAPPQRANNAPPPRSPEEQADSLIDLDPPGHGATAGDWCARLSALNAAIVAMHKANDEVRVQLLCFTMQRVADAFMASPCQQAFSLQQLLFSMLPAVYEAQSHIDLKEKNKAYLEGFVLSLTQCGRNGNDTPVSGEAPTSSDEAGDDDENQDVSLGEATLRLVIQQFANNPQGNRETLQNVQRIADSVLDPTPRDEEQFFLALERFAGQCLPQAFETAPPVDVDAIVRMLRHASAQLGDRGVQVERLASQLEGLIAPQGASASSSSSSASSSSSSSVGAGDARWSYRLVGLLVNTSIEEIRSTAPPAVERLIARGVPCKPQEYQGVLTWLWDRNEHAIVDILLLHPPR